MAKKQKLKNQEVNLQRNLTIAVILLALAYFFTRLFNLSILPIFTDEAIYLYWAKYIWETGSSFFVSVADGKPPLFIWLVSLAQGIFPNHLYLEAGRLVSVVMGGISSVFIFLLTRELFNSVRTALVAAVLYILMPYTLLYDRMVLFDSMLLSMLLTSVYFAVRTVKNFSITHAVLWGGFLGVAALTKPTALMYLVLTIPLFVVFNSIQKIRQNWKRIMTLVLIVIAISQLMYQSLRLSSGYEMFVAKGKTFQYSLSEIIADPFTHTLTNLKGISMWLIEYSTVGVSIAIVISFMWLLRKNVKVGWMLLTLTIIPIVALATIGKVIFPRYFLFVYPYFLIALAYGISSFWQLLNIPKPLKGALLTLLFIPPLQFSFALLTNPPTAPLPHMDYHQYIGEHPSGYGLDEVFSYIDQQKQQQDITIVTEGTFGVFPYAFTLRYWHDPSVEVIPRFPLSKLDPEIFEKAETSKVLILFKDSDTIPEEIPANLLFKAEKPNGKDSILVTELNQE